MGEEKKEDIFTKAEKIFKREKKIKPEPEFEPSMTMEEPKSMTMEEPEGMTMEEIAPEPLPPMPMKKATPSLKKSKLTGHPVARRKHRSILSQKKPEAHKYLNTK